MGIVSRYNAKQLRNLDKDTLKKEANYDDIVTGVLGVTLNAVLLCRESTAKEDQVKALRDQVDRMHDFVNNIPNMNLVQTFIEEGKSGLCAELRPDLLRMIELCIDENSNIDVVVVQEASRFSRNIAEFFNLMQTLQDNGVGILIQEGNYWTYYMNSSDYPRLAMEVSKGQAESLTTQRRVNNGIETYRQRGQLVSGDMFGYRLVKAVDRKNNTFAIDPVEGAIVQLIFKLYTEDGLGSGKIATYLNKNGYCTFAKELNWTAQKIIRVLTNEKYMGYNLYGKLKTLDTMNKKRIKTGIKPIKETIYDDDGDIIQECNLVKGNWEALVSEDVWWKAQEIRKANADQFIHSAKGAIITGRRATSDALAQRFYCCCGYSMRKQNRHSATNNKNPQFSYTCGWQVINKNEKYRRDHGLPDKEQLCSLSSIQDVKMHLMAVKVFSYIFNGATTLIDDIVNVLEMAKNKADYTDNIGIPIETLQEKLYKLNARIDKLAYMKADGDISDEQFQRMKAETMIEIESCNQTIIQRKKEISERKKFEIDIDKVREKLSDHIKLDGYGVANEYIEFFVERIIRRGENEFLWELNLSGIPSVPNKYKVKGYDEEYAKSLKDDNNFNIITTFVISLKECEEFCVKKAKRQFRKKFWDQITVKIAIK